MTREALELVFLFKSKWDSHRVLFISIDHAGDGGGKVEPVDRVRERGHGQVVRLSRIPVAPNRWPWGDVVRRGRAVRGIERSRQGDALGRPAAGVRCASHGEFNRGGGVAPVQHPDRKARPVRAQRRRRVDVAGQSTWANANRRLRWCSIEIESLDRDIGIE